jgi:hypothetical protein
MRITRRVWFKIDFVLMISFLLFLSVFSVRFSYANCLPGYPDYVERVVLVDGLRSCPNSGEMCRYGIKESKYNPAWCCGINVNTTVSPCRIRRSVQATYNMWNWPWPFGDTSKGPCFPVIGTAPCGSPNEITIWHQWVEPLGSESACDPSDCFFCINDIDDIPKCGLENSRCPGD